MLFPKLLMRFVAFFICLSCNDFTSTHAFVPTPSSLPPAAAKSVTRQRGQPLSALGIGKVGWIGGIGYLAVSKSLKIVRQGDVAIVERLGQFKSQLQPGLHVLIPFVDTVRKTLTEREQVLDIPPQKCVTMDNAPLSADAVVYWRVVDAKKAIYSVVDLELAIQNLVLTQLRAEIGKLTLDMTFSAREQVNRVLLDELDVATDPWGVKITRVEVRDIIPNQEIMKAMEQQMAAERTKRASVIKSEGEREKSINEAEGKARSRIIDSESNAKAIMLEAEAEASKLETEAKGVSQALTSIMSAIGTNNVDEAVKFQLTREYIAAQRDLSLSKNSKIIIGSGGRNTVDDILAKAATFFDSDPKKSKGEEGKSEEEII